MQLHLAESVGKIILLRLAPQFVTEAREVIQPNANGEALLIYAKLIAVDAVGCWVENPSWKAIGAKTRKKEPDRHLAHVLLPWRFIVSVAAFPHTEFRAVSGSGIGFLH